MPLQSSARGFSSSSLSSIVGPEDGGDELKKDEQKEGAKLAEGESKTAEEKKAMKPKEIVAELDRFIVGQKDAKRAVAIALRNRWRRHRLDASLKDEVIPKNILMVGPTGVGKTEIARRLAKIANAPFIKVEATKFTEVGFHGRDVDQIIKDLVEQSLHLTKTKKRAQLKEKVQAQVEEKILDALVGKGDEKEVARNRENYREYLRKGQLEQQSVDIDIPQKDQSERSEMIGQLIIGQLLRERNQKRKLTINECRPLLEEAETDRLLSTDDVTKEALKAVEEDGIVFLDEIDKICNPSHLRHGPDASAEGVQRDLLPLIEGCAIQTKHGTVQTDHILFIASGAFHSCKPSDLLSELQGRLPIRVELKDLTEEDFYRILTEPESNLIKQQVALMSTENVKLKFDDSAIKEIARVAREVNTSVENIGARRLHTVIERIVDDISFDAPEKSGTEIVVAQDLVKEKVGSLLKKTDMKRFII
jgi:ATP-dependent HslUV protease ATP-binding subunit HslU